MAFKTEKPDPPKDWDHYVASVGHLLISLGVTDKKPSEVIRAAKLAVVDTDPDTVKNRRASLRRAVRRPKRGRNP